MGEQAPEYGIYGKECYYYVLQHRDILNKIFYFLGQSQEFEEEVHTNPAGQFIFTPAL